jgi:phytoene synthase
MPRDTSFYYSFLVLPPAERRAILSVWDFCRAVDDAVDEPGEGRDRVGTDGRPPTGCLAAGARPASDGARGAGEEPSTAAVTARLEQEMARWRAEVARVFEGEEAATPEGRALQAVVQAFGLSRQPFEDLIDGVAMDAAGCRYRTFDELREYCYRVASTVGLVCIEIFGCRSARAYAIDLGIALQLTNILRDVAADLRRGRLYLPLEDLERFGCTEADLRAGRLTEPVVALLRHQAARAREFYARARANRPPHEARRLVAAEIMGAIYRALLDRIERRGYDVFSEVVRIPRPRRAVIAAATWMRVIAGAA